MNRDNFINAHWGSKKKKDILTSNISLHSFYFSCYNVFSKIEYGYKIQWSNKSGHFHCSYPKTNDDMTKVHNTLWKKMW